MGRMATEVAKLLQGKHKPGYVSHMDCGDHVIVVNIDKIVLTGEKAEDKTVYRHSGFPGGLKSETYSVSLAKDAPKTVSRTIRGMLPKTRLGRAMLNKLKLYVGSEHPHSAQDPKPYEIAAAKL